MQTALSLSALACAAIRLCGSPLALRLRPPSRSPSIAIDAICVSPLLQALPLIGGQTRALAGIALGLPTHRRRVSTMQPHLSATESSPTARSGRARVRRPSEPRSRSSGEDLLGQAMGSILFRNELSDNPGTVHRRQPVAIVLESGSGPAPARARRRDELLARLGQVNEARRFRVPM